ncbi:hypothetical protein [Vitiosangium sp. GDMCC 1.1324]|uniref:DUF6968 family protein n=1 Tax=Vitiosangium sp. (strain GDMCC 1.1324) TaxID=2138576 RepID=UPI000D377A4F|nr:hypothetical protein [Vitiosangium sp. GDMCC 1.1324]PTL76612.1 hypothetical protein DAT35_49275 [Vitiosangium sp. GDMCC 1.1324]
MAPRAKKPTTQKDKPQVRGPFIAERTLTDIERDGSSVRIRIRKPRKDPATGDYSCSFSIEGLGAQRVHDAWGMDSMQALQNAFQAIRIELAPHAHRLRWAGGQDGWLGFPKVIPDIFGPSFTQRLEGLVERETHRFARRLESASRRTRRR